MTVQTFVKISDVLLLSISESVYNPVYIRRILYGNCTIWAQLCYGTDGSCTNCEFNSYGKTSLIQSIFNYIG